MRFSALRLLTCLTLLVTATTVAVGQEKPVPWTLVLHYGVGTPIDSGTLGHCTATFKSDGSVRIVSERRKGDEGIRKVKIYETQSMEPEWLQAFLKAADAALKEKPYQRLGANEDGYFLRLERLGSEPRSVSHNQMNDFRVGPPAMRDLLELLGELVPNQARFHFPARVKAKPADGGP